MSTTTLRLPDELRERIQRLAASQGKSAHALMVAMLGEATAAIQVAGLVDVSAESARLKKEVSKLDGEISKIDAKLGNAQFVAKAPEEVIEEQKERREEAKAAKAKLDAALARLATLKA